MKFDPPLVSGVFLRRYKRFFADVRLDPDGREVTAHCPNTGAMSTCQKAGWPVLLTPNENPARKLRYTWELVHNGRCWICVNTMRANQLVAEALAGGIVRELSAEFPAGDDTLIQREAVFGEGQGRCDFLLRKSPDASRPRGERRCFLEVKSVTLKKDGVLQFPDAPTARGRKHLTALMRAVADGDRAVLFFLAQRSDAKSLRPAVEIDPEYAALLARARNAGVEVLAYQSKITRRGMYVNRLLPLEWD